MSSQVTIDNATLNGTYSEVLTYIFGIQDTIERSQKAGKPLLFGFHDGREKDSGIDGMLIGPNTKVSFHLEKDEDNKESAKGFDEFWDNTDFSQMLKRLIKGTEDAAKAAPSESETPQAQ